MPRLGTTKRPRSPVVPRKGVSLPQIVERLEARGKVFDRDFLTRIADFSARMHRDQKRRSGEPYVTHPIYVAYLLADQNFDQTSVAVGLLHDVLEDTLTTRETLIEAFGTEVAELVDGVTKISQQSYVRRDRAQAETFRKMILASARDPRVIVVKLADRLHNMMTLRHMDAEAQRRISRETLEIYAPIAHRLGMARVRGDLEDLAFYHLYPRQFAELDDQIRGRMRRGRQFVHQVETRLAAALEQAGIAAEISSRVKRYYSIYQKLRRQEIDISQVYDFLAFRIITKNIQETYASFGIVHQIWRPIPGRFKDYIAMPKPNLYQSLHTTVVGDRGQPFEVQIRTREMDRVAEEGIAAHWHYKEGTRGDRTEKDATGRNIIWLRQLLEWQQEIDDPRAFLAQLKFDLYPDEVYVFTPKGEVFSFPRGATPLDFAYRIHTDLGHRMSGARVNGKLVPIKTPLKNGDMVEVMTASGRQPSRDWLAFAATSRARTKIRQWLNNKQRQEAEHIGRRLLERELKRRRVSVRRTLEGEKLQALLSAEGMSRPEDLCQRIGYGKTPVRQVVSRLVGDEIETDAAPEPSRIRRAFDRYLTRASGPVQVRGADDLLATLAKCCRPLPGEPLVGYVTRGRGISVHAERCPNVRALAADPARMIEVEWARGSDQQRYPVSLAIATEDHQGMIARLTEVIAKESSNIRKFKAKTVEPGYGVIEVVIEVNSRKHLNRVRQAIHGLAGVRRVRRQRPRIR